MQKLLISYFFLFIPITSFATTVIVQVEESPIRSTPSFLGKIVDKVTYGESVELVKTQGAWNMIKAKKKKSGWLHEAATSAPKVELTAGSQNVNSVASGKEIALAGKGFGVLETKYQTAHRVNFEWIDKMENFTVKTTDIKNFIKDGGLQGTGL